MHLKEEEEKEARLLLRPAIYFPIPPTHLLKLREAEDDLTDGNYLHRLNP